MVLLGCNPQKVGSCLGGGLAIIEDVAPCSVVVGGVESSPPLVPFFFVFLNLEEVARAPNCPTAGTLGMKPALDCLACEAPFFFLVLVPPSNSALPPLFFIEA